MILSKQCDCCGVRTEGLHRHDNKSYCDACWLEEEPHIKLKECSICGDEYKQDVYDSNVVSYVEGETICIKECHDLCYSQKVREARLNNQD